MIAPPEREEDPFGLIVREIQQGINTEINFSRLYNHFYPQLLRHFIWRGVPQSAAEDLCQEALFNAFRHVGSFEGRSWFVYWLYGIAHNLYANELRRWATDKRAGYELLLQEEHEMGEDDPWRGRAPALVSTCPSPYDEAQCREETEKLRAALDTLPPQMRHCFYLRFYQGLKYHEVAAVMNVTVDTVKAHLGQAKVRLRKLFSNDGGGLGRPKKES